MRRGTHGWKGKLLTLGVSSIVALTLLELGIFVLGLDKPLLWRPHKEIGWEFVPLVRRHWTKEGDGLVRTNSLGFRDRPRSIQSPENVYRVVVFGDSQTAGIQVNLEQTFTYLIEERLTSAHQRVEVLNLGVDGYSPIQELLLMKREIPRLRPDLIVVALFLDNDVSGCVPDLSVSTGGAPFVLASDAAEMKFDYSRTRASFDDFHREPKYTLRRHLQLYNVLFDLKVRLSEDQWEGEGTTAVPTRYELYAEPVEPVWQNAWSVFERIVLEMRAEAQRNNVPVMFVSVPASQVVNDAAWDRIRERYPAMKRRTWNTEYPESRFRKFADHHVLEIVQASKEFHDQAQGPQLFFGDIGHLTARGHELMAQAMAQAMAHKIQNLAANGLHRSNP